MTPPDIAQALSRYVPVLRPARGLREAAVLVPLVATPEGVEVLFIMRPDDMPSHPGQPAFPGGTLDPDDRDSWHAALREADEELGLPAEAFERAGRLDDLATVTGYHVVPWVAWLDPAQPLRPSPREVASTFRAPLAILAEPGRRRTMRGRWRGPERRLTFYLWEPHVIWGATATMVANLLGVVAPTRPTR